MDNMAKYSMFDMPHGCPAVSRLDWGEVTRSLEAFWYLSRLLLRDGEMRANVRVSLTSHEICATIHTHGTTFYAWTA